MRLRELVFRFVALLLRRVCEQGLWCYECVYAPLFEPASKLAESEAEKSKIWCYDIGSVLQGIMQAEIVKHGFVKFLASVPYPDEEFYQIKVYVVEHGGKLGEMLLRVDMRYSPRLLLVAKVSRDKEVIKSYTREDDLKQAVRQALFDVVADRMCGLSY